MNPVNEHGIRRFILTAGAACLLIASDAAASLALAPSTLIDSGFGAARQDEGAQEVDEFSTFEIAVEDVPLPQVLNMLAIQSRKNIVTSKRVGNVSITANLFDVTFREALESILRIAGLCYEEEGNFIYVMTCEEKLERRLANRVLADRTFYLDHISPFDAEQLVTPLLSDKGRISTLGSVEAGFAPGDNDAGADTWAHEAVLVVRDYTENIDSIENVLGEIDVPPRQVLVESTILVTDVRGDYGYGLDISVLLDAQFSQIVNPLSTVNSLLAGAGEAGGGLGGGVGEGLATNKEFAIQSTVGNTSGPGGFKVGLVSDNVSVFLRLLDQVTDSTVLARPKLMALNRQPARVLVGERVAYLSTTQTETAATQTVNYLDTGINLTFRPFISKDGSIRLELGPSVSEPRLVELADINGSVLRVPNEITNTLTTNVRVRDGETIVLGGLFKDKVTIGRRSVPGLGDVPLVGMAFNGQDDTVERQEIIFLVTPTIMREEVMEELGDEAKDYMRTTMVGMRDGLLPWARGPIAANHNRDAYAALETGDRDKALYHLNASLANQRNQPDIVRLREEISGEFSTNSYDDDKLHKMFDRSLRRRNEAGDGIGSAADYGSLFGQVDAMAPETIEEPVNDAPFGGATGTDDFEVIEEPAEPTADAASDPFAEYFAIENEASESFEGASFDGTTVEEDSFAAETGTEYGTDYGIASTDATPTADWTLVDADGPAADIAADVEAFNEGTGFDNDATFANNDGFERSDSFESDEHETDFNETTAPTNTPNGTFASASATTFTAPAASAPSGSDWRLVETVEPDGSVTRFEDPIVAEATFTDDEFTWPEGFDPMTFGMIQRYATNTWFKSLSPWFSTWPRENDDAGAQSIAIVDDID